MPYTVFSEQKNRKKKFNDMQQLYNNIYKKYWAKNHNANLGCLGGDNIVVDFFLNLFLYTGLNFPTFMQ